MSIFDQFRLTVLEKKLGVYGITLYQRGKKKLEHRFRSDDRVNLYSGSKTFTSVGIGICRDEGRLNLDDKVIDFFPEYKSGASQGTEDITIRDLLHMASGKAVFWAKDEEWLKQKPWAQLFFEEPLTYKPGEKFFYSNMCTYMLSLIVEKVSGEILLKYLKPRLFDPLDIFNPQWNTCPEGHTLGATALQLKTEEFSRLGEVFLFDGFYKDKPIVSKTYLTEAITDRIETGWGDPENMAGYGYQLWGCTMKGTYRADGMYGQFCIVLPRQEAVITITSHEEKAANDIIRAAFNDIVPRL